MALDTTTLSPGMEAKAKGQRSSPMTRRFTQMTVAALTSMSVHAPQSCETGSGALGIGSILILGCLRSTGARLLLRGLGDSRSRP
eukprot:756631-Hanusia_phi.AAC.2